MKTPSLARLQMKPLILSLLFAGAITSAARAGSSIAIDFGALPPLDGGYSSLPPKPTQMSYLELAGVIPQRNWNSVIGGTSLSPSSLVDDVGNPTGAMVTWASIGTFATTQGYDMDGDPRMMFGGLAVWDGSTTTITVSGLPASFIASGYDIIVYYDADGSRFEHSIGAYTIESTTLFGRDAIGSSFFGSYIPGQTAELPSPNVAWDQSAAMTVPAGNFMRFEGLTADTFTLTATALANGAPVNGIQIVQVPEPSVATLSLATLAVLVGFRRRRS
jgi:hypothetical protein